MPTARYRVTVNGFVCNRQSWDDLGNWDGKGDEVFIESSIKFADKNGVVQYDFRKSTPVMGDTWGQTGRIQAGSASERGGIVTGDEFPNQRPSLPEILANPTNTGNGPWTRVIPLSTGRNYPPMSIWEGDLTQGEDVVFITPTLWEWDPGESALEGWIKWHKEIDAEFGQQAKEMVAKIWPPAEIAFPLISLGIKTIATMVDVGGPLGSSGSRPIGMNADPTDPTGKTFSVTPITLPLNYSLAEKLINSSPAGLGSGIYPVEYVDAERFKGNYTIYLQVERVDGALPPVVVPPVANTSGYESLGGGLASGPAACSWGAARLDVFARGTDNALWHLPYKNGWGGWEQLGVNQISSNPAAASWGPNRIDVFVRGTDNALYTKSWDGNQWTGYVPLGGELTSGPSVCSWAPGRLDVFARGTDNAMWHLKYDGTWGAWEQLGGEPIGSDPAAVSWGPNRIDVFVRGTDNALSTKSWDGNQWTAYVPLGGSLTSGPAVCSWASGRLDVFARGTDNAMWHLTYDGGWGGWQQLGYSSIGSNPAAASWGPNRIDVFVRGNDGALYHKWWDGVWRPVNPS